MHANTLTNTDACAHTHMHVHISKQREGTSFRKWSKSVDRYRMLIVVTCSCWVWSDIYILCVHLCAGPECGEVVLRCSNDTCNGRGKCFTDELGAYCECASEYEGLFCQLPKGMSVFLLFFTFLFFFFQGEGGEAKGGGCRGRGECQTKALNVWVHKQIIDFNTQSTMAVISGWKW